MKMERGGDLWFFMSGHDDTFYRSLCAACFTCSKFINPAVF